jgi:PAS domain S-box-containing protein
MQNLNGEYLYFNSPPKYGIKAEDVIGKTPFDLHEPEKATKFMERLNQVAESGMSVTVETPVNWKGEAIWFFDQISPIKDNAGNVKALVTISRNITKSKHMEEALRKSEKRYHSLFENSPIALCECDFSKVRKYIDNLKVADGENLRAYFRAHPDEVRNCISKKKINNVNKAALELFRIRSKKDFKKELIRFFAFESYKGIIETIVTIYKGEKSFNMEAATQAKNGEKIHILLKGIVVPGYEKTMEKILVTIIDLTEQKRREDEMKRGMMKFNLEEGNLYLVTEQTSGLSIEAFNDILNTGYPGLAISRTTANKFKKLLNHDFEFIWLSDTKKDGESTLKPNIKELKQYLESQPKKFAILIDRLDYIISKNGFKKTLNFIHFLKEIAYYNNHIIIISIDPLTLDMDKLRQLEKESSEIETRDKVILPLDLLDVLTFTIKQNLIGIRPTYSKIENELGISKPTVRKRIGILMSRGYVIVNNIGNTKVVEATEKGKRFF